MSLSPSRRKHDDIALGADFAGLAVPDDLVRGEVIALARHAHFAAGRHDVGVAVVGHPVGAEFDDLVSCGLVGRRSCGAAARSPGRWPRAAAASNNGSAVHQTNVLCNAARPASSINPRCVRLLHLDGGCDNRLDRAALPRLAHAS